MKKWYIELFVDNGQGGVYHPCGTEYTMLYDDLKTSVLADFDVNSNVSVIGEQDDVIDVEKIKK